MTQLRLIDVATGVLVDTTGSEGSPGPGVWRGDTVVAVQGASVFRTHTEARMFVATVRGGRLRFQTGVDPPEQWSGIFSGFAGARFTDGARRIIEAWYASPGLGTGQALFVCDTAARVCSTGLVETHGARFVERTSGP